jgi:hypothetical protein
MARRLMGLHLYIRSKPEDLIFRGCFKIHLATRSRGYTDKTHLRGLFFYRETGFKASPFQGDFFIKNILCLRLTYTKYDSIRQEVKRCLFLSSKPTESQSN